MNIKVGERKAQIGDGITRIGSWKGDLKYVNPTAAQLKEIYQMDEEPEEPVYSGKDKNEKDWSMLRFLFIEELHKTPVEYKIFISKEHAEFEKDGVTKTWYINQHGESQCVTDKKDLFRSITHLQTWSKDDGKMIDVLDGDSPIELSWRKAYKGETVLYSLLRKLVTQDWFKADTDTNLFIKMDNLVKGQVKELTTWVGTENYQSVVGSQYVEAKDGENGINYFQNCVDQAWMPGWKIKEVNITNSITDGWKKYDEKVNGKGKNREIYQFYQAVKRCKHTTDLKYLHELNPDDHIATSSASIKHTDTNEETTMDYDV